MRKAFNLILPELKYFKIAVLLVSSFTAIFETILTQHTYYITFLFCRNIQNYNIILLQYWHKIAASAIEDSYSVRWSNIRNKYDHIATILMQSYRNSNTIYLSRFCSNIRNNLATILLQYQGNIETLLIDFIYPILGSNILTK